MKSKETSTNGWKKYSHNKLRSQIENIVVRAIIKYNEYNKIYNNSCSLQSKEIFAIKISVFSIESFFLLFHDFDNHGKIIIIEQLRNIRTTSTETLKERLKQRENSG